MRLIATASMLLLALAPQQLPDAAALKKQVLETAKQRRSIQYVRELIGEVTLDGKQVTEVNAAGRRIPVPSAVGRQTVAVSNPGKARVELELGAGNLMVSDGETTWTYRPSTKLYTKIAAGQGPDGVAANLAVLDVMGFFEDSKSAKTVRDGTIQVDGQTYDCWVVTSSVKIPAQAAMGGQISDGVMTSWIDKKLSIAVQVGETRETVEKFLKTKAMTHPVTMGNESGIPAAYAVTVFPTFVLIGSDGKIAAHQFGFNEAALGGIAQKAGLK